jgi:hypothetical protein
MILTAKLKNKAAPWSLLLKPRVTDVVQSGVDYYINTTGINSALTDTTNWFKISNNSNALALTKTVTDIAASGSDYQIDLSGDGLPDLPASIRGYVDLAGTNAFIPLNTDNYNPTTKILSGLNSPTDYPAQIIKLFIL